MTIVSGYHPPIFSCVAGYPSAVCVHHGRIRYYAVILLSHHPIIGGIREGIPETNEAFVPLFVADLYACPVSEEYLAGVISW